MAKMSDRFVGRFGISVRRYIDSESASEKTSIQVGFKISKIECSSDLARSLIVILHDCLSHAIPILYARDLNQIMLRVSNK